jgi:hypothetical protein
MTKQQPGRYFVFTVGKNARGYDNLITGNPADRVTTRINLRADVLNDRSLSTIVGRQWHEGPQQKSPLPRIGRRNI